MMNRRSATQAIVLTGLGTAIAGRARSMDGKAAGASGLPAGQLAAFHVVHGWPGLPDAFYLGQVSGVGVDRQNRVFVFQRGDRSKLRAFEVPTMPDPAVLCFDGETGKLLNSWGAKTFVTPHGLAVDARDNVWVTDIILHQVRKYTPEGKLLMSVGAWRVPGCDATHFNGPTGVAVEEDGSFYVSDGYGNSRVAKFSPEGKFLLAWGRKGSEPGEFIVPHGIAIGPGGRIYVCDRGNDRIQVFTPEGKFLAQWKGPHIGKPWGIARGYDGCMYEMDGGDNTGGPANRGRIIRLDREGNSQEHWGSAGRYDGQLWCGHCVAVDKEGNVYGGDVNIGMRVQKWTRSTNPCRCIPS